MATAVPPATARAATAETSPVSGTASRARLGRRTPGLTNHHVDGGAAAAVRPRNPDLAGVHTLYLSAHGTNLSYCAGNGITYPTKESRESDDMQKIHASLAVTALAAATVIGVSTSASAATGTDSYTLHGVTITGTNTLDSTPWVSASLCNHQSSANSFHFWIKDAQTGRSITPSDHTTPRLAPGACDYIYGEDSGQDAIQVYASSGNLWTFGTDPISLGY